ncbi:MAG: hypothetical protein WBV73_21255 [Phormidium sp.]
MPGKLFRYQMGIAKITDQDLFIVPRPPNPIAIVANYLPNFLFANG